MLIDLSELLSVEGKEKRVEADIEMESFKTRVADYPVIEKHPVQFVFTNVGKKVILAEAQIYLKLAIPCDRCLEDVNNEFNVKVSKEINLNESEAERLESLDNLEYMTEDSKLDVEKFVYDEILVNLPMKVLCNDNCKGICNRCGANLNFETCDCDTTELDPRMAKIRDIFKNV